MSHKGSQERGGEGGDEGGSADEAGSANEAQQHEEDHEEPPAILNDANEVEVQLQVFPLPGWTESHQRVQQCSDQGGLYWPIAGFVMNQPLHQPSPLVFPLPGWTARGHRLVQCTEREVPHCPIPGNMAVIPPQREPQEDDCNCVSCRNENHGQ